MCGVAQVNRVSNHRLCARVFAQVVLGLVKGLPAVVHWETYGGVEQRRQGELQIRSRLIRELNLGYYRQPKTTAANFTKGCFSSGDLGTITVSTVGCASVH